MKAEEQYTTGATPYGSHYASTWDRCERLGFFKFLAPHPKGGVGLSPVLTAKPLRLGGIWHVGLEHYYLSGPRDPGKRDIDRAIHEMEQAAVSRAREWTNPKERDDDVTLIRGMLYDYHQFWRGDPDVMVVEDEDGPLVERNMMVEVPGCDTPFTCRPDAVIEYKGHWVYVMEHKSATVYSMNRIRTGLMNNIQGSGECYVLKRLYPELPTQGVLVNVGVKDHKRYKNSQYKAFERDTATRTEGQLQMFEHHHRLRMERIARLRERYQMLTDDYGDPWQAAQETFIATGASTGACEDTFGRPCEMLEVCKAVGMEGIHTQGYVAYKAAQERAPEGEDTE